MDHAGNVPAIARFFAAPTLGHRLPRCEPLSARRSASSGEWPTGVTRVSERRPFTCDELHFTDDDA